MSYEVVSADIVYGAGYGDESKGKVSSYLASRLGDTPRDSGKTGKYYDFVARWGGGANAGHTVYVNGKRYKTHVVPSGVFHGIQSVIGAGCVVNPESLKEELLYLKENGFNQDLVKVSPLAHVVTTKHIELDKKNLAAKLGTTSRGIAPAYSDKYARIGLQFKDLVGQDPFWKNHLFTGKLYGNVLCEGAQGFYLDINWGNYPYVTSSETLPYAACSLGFSPKKIRDIFAVAKVYDTRSGEDPLFPESLFDNEEINSICIAGNEFGTTTGRRRKVNYLNLDKMIFALNTAGGNQLIISKCDVLEEVKVFKLFYHQELLSFNSIGEMKSFIQSKIEACCPEVEKIYFSSRPDLVEGLAL
jgi:adenylosuccinate synthase